MRHALRDEACIMGSQTASPRGFRPAETDRDRAVRTFVDALVKAWRARYEVASDAERDKACRSLCDLRPPLFIDVVSIQSVETGLVSSAARFVRDPLDAGDTVQVSTLSVHELEALPAPQVRISFPPHDEAPRDRDSDWNGWLCTAREAAPGMARLLNNWRPGRRQAPWSRPSMSRGGDNPPEFYWSVWGPFDGLSIEQVVDDAFHVELPSEAHAREEGSRHQARRSLLTSLPPQEQEPEALLREIARSLPELLAAAGGRDLPPHMARPHVGWWCIPCAPRALVFQNSRLSGDTDLIAGPMYLDVSHARLREAYELELRAAPLERHDSGAWSIAVSRLIARGHLLWPPPMNFLLAVEFKLSYFDTAHDESTKRHEKEKAWKRTHERDQRRILGQLSVPRDAGVDRVSLLHLGITKPRAIPGRQGIIVAAGDVGAADDQFPHLFRGPATSKAELAPMAQPFGHLTKCLGGTTLEAEHDQGATTMPGTLQTGREAVGPYRVETRPAANATASVLPWRLALQRRFAELPKPQSETVAVALAPTGDAILFENLDDLQLIRR